MNMEAVVKFAYTREQEDELDLALGEIVTNVTEVEDGWCSGTLNGREGLFPANFVEVRPKSEPEPPKLRNEQPDGGSSATRKRRAKVTFSYAAENDDELSLEMSQVIEIVGEEEEGWWRGRCNGREGVFPSNFVEPINEDEEVEDPPPYTNFTPGKPDKGRPPSMIAMPGLGGINPIELRQKLKPVTPVIGETKPTPAPAAPAPSSAPLLKAKVMFPYEADQADEISVAEGEIVEVVSTNTDQDGWWKIKTKRGQGLVPDNFLAIMETPPNTTPNLPSKTTDKPTSTEPPDNPPLPPKGTPTAAVPKPKPPSAYTKLPTDIPPKLPAKQPDLPPKKDPPPAELLDIPRQEVLDSSKVKDKPKRAARPPSRNISGVDITTEESTDDPTPPPLPRSSGSTSGKAPWQEELNKRKKSGPPEPSAPSVKPQPPPPTSTGGVTKPSGPPGLRPKPASKPTKPAVPTPKTPEPAVVPSPPSSSTPTPNSQPPNKPLTTSNKPVPPPTAAATTIKEETAVKPSPVPSQTIPDTNNNEWKKAFEQLQAEFKSFKDDIRQEMLKEISILADDLDKERKKTASMQIDIDRLKKSREFRDK